MANVIIDVSAYSQDWAKSAIAELVSNKNVKFIYTDEEKYKNEISGNVKLGTLMKLLIQQGRTINLNAASCAAHMAVLTADPVWTAEPACDDQHIFSMVYLKPEPFILTVDARLTKCRKCIKRAISRRYGNFTSVTTDRIYRRLKSKIMKS